MRLGPPGKWGQGHRCCASPSAHGPARATGVNQPWIRWRWPPHRGMLGAVPAEAWEEAQQLGPHGAGAPAQAQKLPKYPPSSAGLSFSDLSLPVGLDRLGHSPLPHTFRILCLSPRWGLAGRRQVGLWAPLSSLHLTAPSFPASSAAVGSGAPPEAEQAWPQSSGEEELQLQLALAMSKEEADQVPGPGRLGVGAAGFDFSSAIPSSCLTFSPAPATSLRGLLSLPVCLCSLSSPVVCLCAVLFWESPRLFSSPWMLVLCISAHPSPVWGLFLCLWPCLTLALCLRLSVSLCLCLSLSRPWPATPTPSPHMLSPPAPVLRPRG